MMLRNICILKPIFHCDARPFALGPRVGSSPQFRVWDTNMLVPKNAKICVTPNANHQCEQVEYRLLGSPMQNSGVGHVHFFFFGVDFIRVVSRFPVEYGL